MTLQVTYLTCEGAGWAAEAAAATWADVVEGFEDRAILMGCELVVGDSRVISQHCQYSCDIQSLI